jgi:predicted RNA binding protein YcfA (HicA-like mRNA interferase family)
MSKKDKLRQKLKNNPKGRNQQDIETLLIQFGFVLDRIKGSHHFYIYDDGTQRHRTSIPFHNNKVKPEYVIIVTRLLDKLFPEEIDEMVEDEDDES